jgi:hypothetical protein
MAAIIPVASLTSKVDKVSAFIKSHERMLLVGTALLLLWGITGKVQSIIAAHDDKVYAAALATREAQATANAALAQQNAALATQYQQLAQQVQQQNAALESQNAALVTALTKQKATDAKLPAPELAARIESLASLPANSVTPTPGDSFSVTAPAAVKIAQELENVPALQSQLANAQTEKANLDKQISEQAKVVVGLNTEVAGLHKELVASDKQRKAEVADVKANAAKSKRKWFVVGFIAGLSTRGAIKILSGI